MERNTLVGFDFLLMGFVVAGLGFFLADSTPIASFGFALAVIGALVLLVVPESVPRDAFRALLKDAVRNVEIILEEAGLRNRAYFMQTEDGEVRALVPLSATGSEQPLSPAEVSSAPRRFVVSLRGVTGLLLIPPGNEIVRLARVEKGADLEEALRQTLVEFSDLARGVIALEEQGGKVAKIQITKPQLGSDSPYFNDALGTPVSCVAACTAAVAKGAAVRIIEERYDPGFIRLTLEVV
ncbi:MAG TPA: hypothetical protein VLX33_00015 [Nitrososphaerales archaeon]|nr:hypothetical protein [Nitrososphaerales archaeon]